MSKRTEIVVNGHGYVIDQATGRCVETFDLVRVPKKNLTPDSRV